MARAKTDQPRGARRVSSARVISTSSTRKGAGARWRVASDAAPSFDAVALVDHISDVILGEHYLAITEGRRAEGPEKQPALVEWGKAGRDAKAGARPNVRGYTGSTAKPFADNLERSPIKVSGKARTRSRVVQGNQFQRFVVNETVEGTRAKTTIRPDKIHETFMALEEKRGNQFLFVTGYVSEAVDRALASYLGLALDGALAKGDKRERKAAKARSRGK